MSLVGSKLTRPLRYQIGCAVGALELEGDCFVELAVLDDFDGGG